MDQMSVVICRAFYKNVADLEKRDGRNDTHTHTFVVYYLYGQLYNTISILSLFVAAVVAVVVSSFEIHFVL